MSNFNATPKRDSQKKKFPGLPNDCMSKQKEEGGQLRRSKRQFGRSFTSAMLGDF
jgi:hypothetical protein